MPLPPVELEPLDAVIVTHLHRDHYDPTAAETLRKELPVFTQPPSGERLRGDGFADVRPVEDELDWEDIRVARTGGR
ncbi:MAG TPA: MBL fold metallo-hydrolase, partial [Gaiellaceae bacterium]